MRTWGWAVLLACVACGGSAAPGGPPVRVGHPAVPMATRFAGCTAIHRDADADDADCPGLSLQVFRPDPHDLDYEGMLTRYLAANGISPVADGSWAETSAVEPHDLELAAGRARGRRYRLTSLARHHVEEGFLAIGAGRDHATRFVVCKAHRPDDHRPDQRLARRCKEVMTQALEQGIPAEVFASTKTADEISPVDRFAGRSLTVPAGCEAKGLGNDIDCGLTGRLTWTDQVHEAVPLETVAAQVIAGAQTLAKAEDVALSGPFVVPCLIDGVAASCSNLRVERGPGALIVYSGIATVRGIKLHVLCSWQGQPDDAPPPPCDQVLVPAP